MSEKRFADIKRILWIILFANIAVAAAKIIVGVHASSRSIFADGIHSVGDSFSNVLGLIGIYLAKKPVDRRHPYGHGKFEIIVSMMMGIMLACMALRLFSGAAEGMRSPKPIRANVAETVAVAATVVINAAVAAAEYRAGRRLSSRILVTDSRHTRGDVLISCGVLAGTIALRLGAPQAVDCIISVCVAVFILFSGLKIIKDCVEVLADSAAVESERIADIIRDVDGVMNVHKIRSRGDAAKMFIDLHVIVRSDMEVRCAHELSHKLEKTLKEHFGAETEAIIHIEPDDGKHKNCET